MPRHPVAPGRSSSSTSRWCRSSSRWSRSSSMAVGGAALARRARTGAAHAATQLARGGGGAPPLARRDGGWSGSRCCRCAATGEREAKAARWAREPAVAGLAATSARGRRAEAGEQGADGDLPAPRRGLGHQRARRLPGRCRPHPADHPRAGGAAAGRAEDRPVLDLYPRIGVEDPKTASRNRLEATEGAGGGRSMAASRSSATSAETRLGTGNNGVRKGGKPSKARVRGWRRGLLDTAGNFWMSWLDRHIIDIPDIRGCCYLVGLRQPTAGNGARRQASSERTNRGAILLAGGETEERGRPPPSRPACSKRSTSTMSRRQRRCRSRATESRPRR